MLSLPDEAVLTTTSRYLRAAGMTLAHSWATADDSSFHHPFSFLHHCSHLFIMCTLRYYSDYISHVVFN